MKRVISGLLILAVLLALTGCSKTSDTAAHTDTTSINLTPSEASVAPTDYINPQLEIPMLSASLPAVQEIEYADNGEEIFRYIYQNMSLILPDPEVADKIIVDFLNRVDQTTADAASIKAAAKADYTTGNWSPYLCQILYSPMRTDAGALSLFGSYTTYRGSAHPESVDISVNYDLVTGEVIQLDSLFPSEPTDLLISEVIQALVAQKEEKLLFDNFQDTVRERFKRGLSHENNWYFSNTGLCFYFSTYDIAPYSSGVIVAEIPYQNLAGFMNDAYFPAEIEAVHGALQAELFHDGIIDQFNAFSEIIIHPGATKTLLYTDSTIYDVRIEIGSWSTDGSEFIPDFTLYAAYALTADDAIMVESEIPDTLPRLRITYKTGGQLVRCYLSDSGKDGSIILSNG